MNSENSLAFTKLKPLLVNFLHNCTVENVTEIENALKDLEPNAIETLQEFILIPFVAHLNTKLPERITIKHIDFMTFLFQKIEFCNWTMFTDIFNVLTSKISNVEDMNKTACTSEELKISVCDCLLNMICCSSETILNELYSFTFRPQLAYAFFTLGIMLKEEKSKAVLKAALKTLGALCYNDSYLKPKYKMTELIASEALASCFPGLSISLLKVITGDDKQPHHIITMALDILGKLIVLIIGDKSFERGISHDTSSEIHWFAYKSGKLSRANSSSMINSIPCVLKNEAWFKSVAENLEIMIKNMKFVSAHSHYKVRYYFLKFSESLLYNCNKTLSNIIPTLLPLIFALSVDSNNIIASSAKSVLVSLSEKLQNMDSLNKIAEENIEKLVSELIKCKFSSSDTKKLAILKSLLGYIELSNASLYKLMFSVNFLKKILLTFLSLLEFDITELNLIEELPAIDDLEAISSSWPKKRFKFFENEEILHVICKMCYSFGRIGNTHLLIEYLLEKLSSNDFHTLECIFVIGSFIKGLSNESDVSQKYSSLISDILEVFLSPSFFDVPLDNIDTHQQVPVESNCLTHNASNKNKLQICLLLEAIANCSECLKADFKIHLMTVLCPVMEKAGNSNYIISHCGLLCLQHIAKFCQYASIQNMIKKNSDYITNLMMVNFYGYLDKPETAVVLRVAMEHNDAEAVVLFKDLIFQILDFLDYNQDKAYSLLYVLLSVAKCIKKWFPSKKDFSANNSSKNSIKNLRKDLEDYIKLKKIAAFEMEAEDNTDLENSAEQNDNDDYNVEEKKPEVPLHINIICEIFKRCVHLQASENRFARMLTLEIVEICILALSDYENELHPLVHEFWAPFLKRFTEDTFVPKAFNVLLTIVNQCADFVRNRTFKEVMPKILLFLKQEYSKSCLMYYRQYQYTSNHSLQTLLLSEVGNLCTKLSLTEKEFHSVANICVSYVKKDQPKSLQEAAMKSLKALSTVDSDAVWFYLNVAYSKDKVLNPPHESLASISFPYCDNSLTTVDIVL